MMRILILLFCFLSILSSGVWADASVKERLRQAKQRDKHYQKLIKEREEKKKETKKDEAQPDPVASSDAKQQDSADVLEKKIEEAQIAQEIKDAQEGLSSQRKYGPKKLDPKDQALLEEKGFKNPLKPKPFGPKPAYQKKKGIKGFKKDLNRKGKYSAQNDFNFLRR